MKTLYFANKGEAVLCKLRYSDGWESHQLLSGSRYSSSRTKPFLLKPNVKVLIFSFFDFGVEQPFTLHIILHVQEDL